MRPTVQALRSSLQGPTTTSGPAGVIEETAEEKPPDSQNNLDQ